MKPLLFAFVFALSISPQFCRADGPEQLPKGIAIASLKTEPKAIRIDEKYAYSQLTVYGVTASGEQIDLTRQAAFAPSAGVSISPTGVVTATTDGTGSVKINFQGKSVDVPITISGTTAKKSISFVQDVQPMLSKLGCNAGTCHGAQAGKNGFKLSLRGYDPLYDHRALTDDLEGRRFNRAAPERSLMLLKSSGAVPHVGGVLWQPGQPAYEIVRQWIAEGVKLDLTSPRIASIQISPNNPTLPLIGMKQQFSVVATFTDGKTRDVSGEAFLESSNTDVAIVDKTGLVTSLRRGETTMLARYEGAYAASTIIVMGDRSKFQWEPRPIHNPLDSLVDAKLQKMRIQPSELCDNSEFIRRVMIDLTGLPPTADDVRKFLADPRPDRVKRDAMIDSLVGSDAYIEQWTNKWADLLQVNRKFLGDPGATALRKWIRDELKANTPYDKFCYNILTATGSNVENPPAAYFKVLRDADALMENTTQLFLAIRFNCNKCHDHPFEKWTQDQYYQLGAYFAQVARSEDPKYKGQKIGGSAVEGATPLVEIIKDANGGEVKHARTNAVTPPKFPYPHSDLAKADAARRVQVAQWITSPKNPYFAKSYVNRVWSYLLGVGIIEPVDDIRAGNPATNPELLDRLTNDFVASGFNVQELIKTICKSRTYQLSIKANPWNKDDETNFSHATARRLPAEVLYDSVYKSTGSMTRLPGLPAGSRAAQLIDSNVELPGGFLDLLGKPVRESACECERSSSMMLGPILAFVSGPVVGDAVHDPNNHITKFTVSNKDDAKVVDEIYFSILNRAPTAAEVAIGVKIMTGSKPDHDALMAEYNRDKTALDTYAKSVPAKQAAWLQGLRDQKPTDWQPLSISKTTAKSGATFAKQADGSYLVSGPVPEKELYTILAETKLTKITGIRLEVLADESLPSKGPGRAATNGNFVLSEFKLNFRPTKTPTEKPKNVAFVKPQATFEQGGFAITSAIDNNPGTGWALSPELGKSHAAVFPIQGNVGNADGLNLTFVLEQNYGSGHSIGRFRLSATTDKNVRVGKTLPDDLLKLVSIADDKLTPAQQTEIRNRYLATDKMYQELAQQASKVPPSDARVLAAQDLTWALLNSPAFLFNR